MCTPMFIATLFTVCRTWKQPRCSLANEQIRKLWYIYTMEYYSAIKKNAFESVLMRWMKLQPIIQSEVSQKEKHEYSILTRMEFRKMITMTLYVRQQKRHRDKNRLLDSVGEGKGGMIWENSIETCILPYVKQMTSPGSMHKTGHSKSVLWDNPEGWDGEGGRSGVQDTCTPMGDSCQHMAKTTTIL